MCAIAERLIGGLLTLAEPCRPGFLGGEFQGSEAASLVCAIAKRLRAGEATGAKPIVLPGF